MKRNQNTFAPREKTDAEKQQDFLRAYEKLCGEHGLQLLPILQWRQSADTGMWSTAILLQITAYSPKKDG